jgi:hypothetical protein
VIGSAFYYQFWSTFTYNYKDNTAVQELWMGDAALMETYLGD